MKNGIIQRNGMPTKKESRMQQIELTEKWDKELAEIIRHNLKMHGLDLPGTVYYDPELDHLSTFYMEKPDKRGYVVLIDEEEHLLGGVGYAEFENIPDCAELQKLYLTDKAKGKGLGKMLVELVQEKAKEKGYKQMYLETHTNLAVAIMLYKKCGFVEIKRPDFVNHGTMDTFFYKMLE